MIMKITKNEILWLLKEDDAMQDITTNSIIMKNKSVNFKVISKNKEDFVLCGIEAMDRALAVTTAMHEVYFSAQNGDIIPHGGVIFEGKANIKELLCVERVVLNVIQHLSGISTKTKKFVDAINNEKIKIFDTRKTMPYLRNLQKYAVTVGGGYNHRFTLSDMILIKDNHIAIVGGVKDAIRLAKKNANNYKIEIECDTLFQVEEVSKLNVDIIMLDNMSTDEIAKASEIIRKNSKSIIEVSGGVNLSNIQSYQNLDIDRISIGALTHSVEAVDISLEI